MPDIDADLEEWLMGVVPRAVAYARSLLRHHEDAEDTVHDVLFRLISHREYDLPRDGEKLLFRSITNACINRRSRAREMASLDAAQPGGERLASLLASERESDPAGIAMTAELSDAVERGLKKLPPLQRAAVELKALGTPLREIGEILGLSPSNAGVLVHRGRKQLASELAPYMETRD